MNDKSEAYKTKAVRSICADLKAMIAKRQRKLDDIESGKKGFATVINGEEYRTEHEIYDAYGCGMITEAQRRSAIKKLEAWQHDENADALRFEIKSLGTIRANLMADLKEGRI